MYVCNSLTSTEAKKQEGLPWQLVAQCEYRFPNYDIVTCEDFVKNLKLRNLRNSRHCF